MPVTIFCIVKITDTFAKMLLRYSQISIDNCRMSLKLITYTAEAYGLSTCEKRSDEEDIGPKDEEIIRKVRKFYSEDVSQMIIV